MFPILSYFQHIYALGRAKTNIPYHITRQHMFVCGGPQYIKTNWMIFVDVFQSEEY